MPKKTTRKQKERAPLREDLIKRVAEAKTQLPKSGVTSLFFHYFDVIDSVKNKSKLSNVLQFRTTDADFTEKLEKLVTLLNNK